MMMSLRTCQLFAIGTTLVDLPTYLVAAFPTTPRSYAFNEAFRDYLEVNSDAILDERNLFKKKNTLRANHLDDAQTKFTVRFLEHEHLQKRLRRAELETQLLSAELAASLRRMEEAQSEINKVLPHEGCAAGKFRLDDPADRPLLYPYTPPTFRASYDNVDVPLPFLISDLENFEEESLDSKGRGATK